MIGLLVAGLFLMGLLVMAVLFASLLFQAAVVDATPGRRPSVNPAAPPLLSRGWMKGRPRRRAEESPWVIS